MLLAQLFDEQGQPRELIAADTHDKAFYMEMSVRDRLRCSACGNTAIHVGAHPADGNSYERVAHFRAEHEAGCLLADDPRDPRFTGTFLAALRAGHPILINVNFVTGFKRTSLGNKFNPLTNSRQTGIWRKSEWIDWVRKEQGKEYITVSARDVTDIIFYLDLAKKFGMENGNAHQAMTNLWFNTDCIVQACQRFVIKNDTTKLQRVLQPMIDYALESAISSSSQTKHPSDIRDAPRLFLFHATGAQIKKASEKKDHLLYGQQLEVPVEGRVLARDGRPIRTGTANHVLKMGMRLNDGLDNRAVLAEGANVWVVATPTLSRRRAFQVSAKAVGDIERVEPAFCLLRVRDRRQFVSDGNPALRAAA